jgi:hypothetical protein
LQAQQYVAPGQVLTALAEQLARHALHQVALSRARRELLADHHAKPAFRTVIGAHVEHEMRAAPPGPQSKNG